MPPTLNVFRSWNDFLCTCTSLLPCFSKVWLGVLKSTLVGVLHDPCLKLYCLLLWDLLISWNGLARTIQDAHPIHYTDQTRRDMFRVVECCSKFFMKAIIKMTRRPSAPSVSRFRITEGQVCVYTFLLLCF